MYMTEGGSTKTTPDITFQTKIPDKTPRSKTPHELTQTSCVYAYTTKNGGSEMCDVLWRVPRRVTKCDRGGGSKLVQNSVTYFMDGSHSSLSFIIPSIIRLFCCLSLQPPFIPVLLSLYQVYLCSFATSLLSIFLSSSFPSILK